MDRRPGLVAELDLDARTLDRIVAEAAGSYQRVPGALAGVPRVVLDVAVRLAGGNLHRLSTEGDGTVVVHNAPVW